MPASRAAGDDDNDDLGQAWIYVAVVFVAVLIVITFLLIVKRQRLYAIEKITKMGQTRWWT